MSGWLSTIASGAKQAFSSAAFGAANTIYSMLPKNEHATKAIQLQSQIDLLNSGLADKTSGVFKDKVAEQKSKLQQEERTCLASLIRLNGEFFQDPKSSLKKAWDTVVQTVQDAISFNVEKREDLTEADTRLKAEGESNPIVKAKSAIDIYSRLETKRDTTEQRLSEIISIEKTDTVTSPSEANLQRRQQELCGDYYEDPNSLLDQAWKAYQREVEVMGPHSELASELLNRYNSLENERKSIDVLLKKINSAPVGATTFESITETSISKDITALEKQRNRESDLEGVSWTKTAAAAATTAGTALSAGYVAPVAFEVLSSLV